MKMSAFVCASKIVTQRLNCQPSVRVHEDNKIHQNHSFPQNQIDLVDYCARYATPVFTIDSMVGFLP